MCLCVFIRTALKKRHIHMNALFVIEKGTSFDESILALLREKGVKIITSTSDTRSLTKAQEREAVRVAKRKMYYAKPDVVEKRKTYYQRPDVKEKRHLYNTKDEVKERKKNSQKKRHLLIQKIREEMPDFYEKIMFDNK